MWEIERFIKILLIGDSFSGKTALILRLVDNCFINEYHPALGMDLHTRQMKIGEKKVKMSIYDSSGKKKCRDLVRHSNAHGYMIVFYITNRKTFDDIDMFYRVIRITQWSGPIVIIGTHSDLYKEREVSGEEGRTIASKYEGMYIEVSSKIGNNVSIVFEIFCAKITDIQTHYFFPEPGSIQIAPTVKKVDLFQKHT